MMNYSAIVDREAGGYGAWFPDLPGCAAMGDTFVELIFNAADAMRDWAEFTTAKGRALASPRPIEVLKTDPEVVRAIREGALLRDVPLILTTESP
jgi:predicted RNase H-like HicB family nuclease